MSTTIWSLLAVVAGALIGWWLRGRFAKEEAKIEGELREQLSARGAELNGVRADLGVALAARAAADAAKSAADESAATARQEKAAVEIVHTATQRELSEKLVAVATLEASAQAQSKLVASLQDMLAEQRKAHELNTEAATATLKKITAELDSAKSELADLGRKLATATAELAARDQTLGETQAALAALRTAAAECTRKSEEDQRGLTTKLQEVTTALATAEARLKSEHETTATLRQERDALSTERARLQENLSAARQRQGELESENTFLKERIAEERKQVESIQERFRAEFETISNKLLVDSSSKFDKQSAESLSKLLEPLRENLTQFRTSLDATRTETVSQNAVLRETILRIGSEAANLTKALKGDAKVLGNWGENMLDQLLEKSGLQRDVHYRRQPAVKDDAGDTKYLDVVIDLPEGRHLIIDSKVSLRAFEEAMNGADDTVRTALLDQHVDATRRHFRNLGDKAYPESHGINAPDFVLMYIPIEAAYLAALNRAPGLFGEALDRNVVLISNSTLLATLRTVAGVWRLADQQRNAQEIADRGGKLYDKFVGFIADMEEVGAALAKGQEAWESASGKLHQGVGNLVRQAEMLKSLKVTTKKGLPPALVEKAGAEPQILN